MTTVTTPELSKGFEPKEVEARWYRHSLEHGVFRASDDPDDHRPSSFQPMNLGPA